MDTSSIGSPLGAEVTRRKELEKGDGKEDSSIGEGKGFCLAGDAKEAFSFIGEANDDFSFTGEGKEVSWIREGNDSCSGEAKEVS